MFVRAERGLMCPEQNMLRNIGGKKSHGAVLLNIAYFIMNTDCMPQSAERG